MATTLETYRKIMSQYIPQQPQTLQLFYKAMTPQQRKEIKKLLEANRKKPFICKTILMKNT